MGNSSNLHKLLEMDLISLAEDDVDEYFPDFQRNVGKQDAQEFVPTAEAVELDILDLQVAPSSEVPEFAKSRSTKKKRESQRKSKNRLDWIQSKVYCILFVLTFCLQSWPVSRDWICKNDTDGCSSKGREDTATKIPETLLSNLSWGMYSITGIGFALEQKERKLSITWRRFSRSNLSFSTSMANEPQRQKFAKLAPMWRIATDEVHLANFKRWLMLHQKSEQRWIVCWALSCTLCVKWSELGGLQERSPNTPPYWRAHSYVMEGTGFVWLRFAYYFWHKLAPLYTL